MAAGDDVRLLVEFGLVNEEGVARLANLIRGVQSLAGGGGGFAAPAKARRRGRPPKGQAGGASATPAAKKGRGGKRTPFNVSKEDLQKARETMTVRQIAQKYGVSSQTIFLKLKKLGLTQPKAKKK